MFGKLINLFWFSLIIPSLVAAGPLAYTGVNISGGEYGNPQPGKPLKANFQFVYPSAKEVAYFHDNGMNVFRIPFHWETIQPMLNQPLDPAEIDRLAQVVKTITDLHCIALLDPHNFARYYGKVIGSSDVPADAFGDFWSRLAERFKDDPQVWFGLMNEPHDMPGEQWLTAANSAIAAVRKTGSTNLILVPGISWTGAHSWISSGNAVTMLKVVDPKDHFIFEVHQYVDSDSSGTKPLVVSPTIGKDRLKSFTAWCRQNHRKAFLGEFAVPASPQGKAALEIMLQSMQEDSDIWTGYTWWAAGPWWNNYMFSIEPKKDGSPAPQMDYLRPFLQPIK